jgi:diguanylate cyclase (GGDEF)-like protein
MYELLTSNFNTHKSKEIRQLILLNSFLFLAALSSLFFVCFNFYFSKSMPLVFLNVVAFLISILAFFELRRNKNLERSSIVAALLITIFFMILTYYNENEGYGLFWTPLVSVFVIGLMGSRGSLMYLLPYFVFVFSLAFSGIGEWQGGSWNSIGFVRLVFSSLLITFVVVMMDLALMHSDKNFEKISTTDALTNIKNRGAIQDHVVSAIEESKRHKHQLSLILFDIDDFKKINDTLGHNTGDNVLRKIAHETRVALRISDSFGRWGGEEFLVVLSQVSQEEAINIAQKLRLLIEALDFETPTKVTSSFGVCVYDEDKDTFGSLLERVDRAMYSAKKQGKNRVVFL